MPVTEVDLSQIKVPFNGAVPPRPGRGRGAYYICLTVFENVTSSSPELER